MKGLLLYWIQLLTMESNNTVVKFGALREYLGQIHEFFCIEQLPDNPMDIFNERQVSALFCIHAFIIVVSLIWIGLTVKLSHTITHTLT